MGWEQVLEVLRGDVAGDEFMMAYRGGGAERRRGSASSDS